MKKSMRISPRFTSDEWLKLDASNEKDWDRAIEIFEDRIEGRFLRPAQMIRNYKWSGFALLALDSLLIETMQQFWEGVPRTPSKLNSKGCKQLQSEPYFRAFLRGPLFKADFSRQTARLFYKTVRSAILHQAETEGTTTVQRKGTKAVSLRPDGHGIRVHPLKIHDELELAIKRYGCASTQ